MTAQDRVWWSEAIRALPTDETQSYAIGQLRRLGFSPSSVATSKKAKAALADTLTRIEDMLESTRHDCRPIRAIRRAIELELWP